ncbi:MAG: DUF5320 domain-containing protein [Candidatus Omnitrophota bacterium]
MPGYDGTGPNGKGAMTGGGRGYCAVSVGKEGSFGSAGRYSRRGAGRGRRNRYYATGLTGWQRSAHARSVYGRGPYPYSEPALDEEKEVLKEEAEVLRRELEDVQSRIQSLEQKQKEERKEK